VGREDLLPRRAVSGAKDHGLGDVIWEKVLSMKMIFSIDMMYISRLK
jgi:hypothetical protein